MLEIWVRYLYLCTRNKHDIDICHVIELDFSDETKHTTMEITIIDLIRLGNHEEFYIKIH